jgi:hypothetical protein
MTNPTDKRDVIVLTTVPPIGADGGRQEKVTYRCNRLLEAGYKPIVIRPEFTYSVQQFDLQEGTVEYHGQEGHSYDPVDDSETAIDLAVRWLKDALNSLLQISFGTVSDPQAMFLPTTTRRIHSLIDEDIVAINTQSYPFTNNIVGLLIKLLHPHLQWIMEYRDPWVGNPRHFPDNGNRLSRKVEKACITNCDDLVYYDGIQVEKGYYESKFSDQAEKIHRIGHIGYNDRVMDSVSPKVIDPFTIIYAGTFYTSSAEESPLFDGFYEFIQKNNIDKTEFQLMFLGDKPNSIKKEVGEFVTFLNWLPYSEAMSYVKGADYGLYINSLNSGDELNVSTKMYDYIGAGTPVLCLSKEGWESWEFVINNDLGTAASINEQKEIRKAMEEIYYNGKYEIKEEVRDQFARRKPWERFLSLLKSGCDTHSSPQPSKSVTNSSEQ